MNILRKDVEGLILYYAGVPNFPRIFSRDSIISSMIIGNTKMLKDQLIFCSLKQGTKRDPITGEEPGKIFHEYPGYIINGLSTEFNACDTTALFLIAHKFYFDKTGDKKFLEENKRYIENAVKYILSHIKDGLFYEDPKLANTDRFALKVTYWKDSEIFGREKGIPKYPIVYTLAHIQNMAGLRCASFLLKSSSIKNTVEKMREALNDLWDEKNSTFYLAVDKTGKIEAVSSDALHSLFYLEPGDIDKNKVEKIVNSSKILETSAGYRTLSPNTKVNDQYHSETVWPFEQAMINIGARKFKSERAKEVSSRIVNFLSGNPEYFTIDKKEIKPAGCDPQLWTIAAKKYFSQCSQ